MSTMAWLIASGPFARPATVRRRLERCLVRDSFAVEFERDSTNQLVYRITAACPTAAGMGPPVQKAELGHHDQETYQQRATTIAQKMLQGGSNYPAPETVGGIRYLNRRCR